MNDIKIMNNEIKNNEIYSEKNNKSNRSTSPQDDALLEKKRLFFINNMKIKENKRK
jgi:hypothetical protein